ncbi:hypothetical protein Lalb_Chr23g0277641 [Lupinus albus]|uniref:Uncharacterized protein n=1 Tax=Lupinus albus TaxID=3870 RepID=A0A6A4NJS2_LUPAL|nr:hypothetical protein Lalb_Chr23g0277641 [Lupinus albus]
MFIAEHRESNPRPRMLLSLVNESPCDHKNLVRSQSFSLLGLDDNVMKDYYYQVQRILS